MVVAGNTPTANSLTKIGKMQSAGCRLCRIAREARGESTDGVAAETHGHINSAGCKGMATTVTAAHHSIWRHLKKIRQNGRKMTSFRRGTAKLAAWVGRELGGSAPHQCR